MPWTARRRHVRDFELGTGDAVDARLMNLIVDYNLNNFIFQTQIHSSEAHDIQLQYTMRSGGYANSSLL